MAHMHIHRSMYRNSFTGTCTDSNNGNAKLGVQCQAICSPNKPYYYSKGVIAGCSATVRMGLWCWQKRRFIHTKQRLYNWWHNYHKWRWCCVSGTLEIVGNNSDMSNLITITAANNQRHLFKRCKC